MKPWVLFYNECWSVTAEGDAKWDSRAGLLAAEMMAAKRSDDAKRPYHHFVRVSVLSTPWHYSRVRMRVRRNERPGMSPVFRMVTHHSDWSHYGRSLVRLNTSRLPQSLRALVVVPDAAAGVPTFAEWAHAIQGKFSLGPALQRLLERDFRFRQSVRSLPFWNAAEAADARRQVSGILFQALPDRHPIEPSVGEGSTRHDVIPRSFIPATPASAIPTLLSDVRKQEVRTVYPRLLVVWTDHAGAPVLEMTWPVRWS